MEREKIWTVPFTALVAVSFLTSTVSYLLLVAMPDYAHGVYEAPLSMSGWTLSAYIISALLTRLLFGRYMDRIGNFRLLIIGCIINLIACALNLVQFSFPTLLVVRVIHGVAFAFISSTLNALAALILPRSRFGEGMSYFTLAQALSTGIGPFLSMYLKQMLGGYSELFIVTLIVAAVCLPMLSLIRVQGVDLNALSQETESEGGESQPAGDKKKRAIVQMQAVPLSIVLCLIFVIYGTLISHIVTFSTERGIVEAASLYFFVYSIMIFITRPIAGRLLDAKGENAVVYVTLCILIVGTLLVVASWNGVVLLVSAVFIAIGIGVTQSCIMAVIMKNSPADEVALASSTFLIFADVGSGAGTVPIGFVIGAFGYNAGLGVLTGVAVVALVAYYFLHGRKASGR